MAQHLLHGTLHATIYEVDNLHTGGLRSGFLGKVYLFLSFFSHIYFSFLLFFLIYVIQMNIDDYYFSPIH